MKVLVVHNFYQQPGGEDQVFRDEVELLRSHGDEVHEFTVHNDEVQLLGKLSLARKTIWNSDTYDRLAAVVREKKPQVVHFHNTFPLLSPSVYFAARDHGAAVVQTLHNYRLICPAATCFRDGHVCEDCVGRTPFPAVRHRCYRSSLSASAVTASMLTYHRMKGTWKRAVDVYIALTEFARSRYVAGGLPAERIVVKPNFASSDPGVGPGGGGYVVFIGRLTEEKGIRVLLNAAELFSGKMALKILGDGPLRPEVEAACARLSHVSYLGRLSGQEVYATVGKAEALVFPSIWYEGLPKTIVESFAKGTPVIASRLGSMSELVEPDKTGWLFEPGNPGDLAERVGALRTSQVNHASLRKNSRDEFLRIYTAERNYPMLIAAYRKALGELSRSEVRSQGRV